MAFDANVKSYLRAYQNEYNTAIRVLSTPPNFLFECQCIHSSQVLLVI